MPHGLNTTKTQPWGGGGGILLSWGWALLGGLEKLQQALGTNRS